MKKSKISPQPATKDNAGATARQGRNDHSVREALKKEKQPDSEDDFSPLHNNKSIGTTGGDQRSSENDEEQKSA